MSYTAKKSCRNCGYVEEHVLIDSGVEIDALNYKPEKCQRCGCETIHYTQEIKRTKYNPVEHF